MNLVCQLRSLSFCCFAPPGPVVGQIFRQVLWHRGLCRCGWLRQQRHQGTPGTHHPTDANGAVLLQLDSLSKHPSTGRSGRTLHRTEKSGPKGWNCQFLVKNAVNFANSLGSDMFWWDQKRSWIMNDYEWLWLEPGGYLSTASRDTPFMVLLFFSYEQFKAWKIRLTFADDVPSQLLAPMKPWSDAETAAWSLTVNWKCLKIR